MKKLWENEGKYAVAEGESGLNYNFSNLTMTMWLVQTVAATFFTAGFVGFDVYLWRQAFGNHRYKKIIVGRWRWCH